MTHEAASGLAAPVNISILDSVVAFVPMIVPWRYLSRHQKTAVMSGLVETLAGEDRSQ